MATLYLLPATEEARVICEQFDELEEEKPPPPSSSFTTDCLPFGLLALALVLVDVAIDLSSFINSFYVTDVGHQWLIYFLCALVITGIQMTLLKVPISTESMQERRIRQKYHELCQCGDIVEVHYKLIRRWSKIRYEVGINTTEPRAYLEEFPEVVRQIIELRETIKSLSGKVQAELQSALSNRITQIMRKALEPLAVELKIARNLEILGQEMVREAEEEVVRQQQLTHAAVASACSELRAQHLLRVI